MGQSPEVIDMSPEDLAALQERLRTNSLEEADAERLIGVLNAVTWLYTRLNKAKLSRNCSPPWAKKTS